MNINEYIKAVDEQFATGLAREHSYRPALQQLLAELLPDFVVTNEPAHFDCGAPDYIISERHGAHAPVFFVEAKDLFDPDLDGQRQHREQFMRYKRSLDNIIFTDYLDFHVFEHGEPTQHVRLAEERQGHIRLIRGADQQFLEMVHHLAGSRPQPITSASRLAELMAAKARLLADVIAQAFQNAQDPNSPHYHENAQLEGQLAAFRRVLIHDLQPQAFADIYAQTIAYGMFAARLHDETPDNFSRQEAAVLIPKTNPFLRQIFQQIAGYDLDERIAWIVDDLARTFLATDVERVMQGYGQNQLHSDPMIHFYEDFLSAYDPRLRKAKGVWYTPQPVVNFIVRAVDDVLRHDFHLPMGLADSSRTEHEVTNDQYTGRRGNQKTLLQHPHRVQILDPATGTGTFLSEVVSLIHQRLGGMQGVWQNYVEEHLLPRLNGFELLMASYAIAHLKLDMQLRQLGYDSSRTHDKRLNIFLTNSLEEHHPDTGNLFSTWLSNEANEANYIKRDCPVMVMVGNPPYSISSSNKSDWIKKLINDYKQNLDERNLQPLSDDYIKFIRLAQDYIERNGQGVVGYITNNSYLDGIIHREMRRQLLTAFSDIYVINLHGNSRKKEIAPDGTRDENVFDIMQGVCIAIFVRKQEHSTGEYGRVHYHDIYGTRENKYQFLKEHSLYDDIEWQEIEYSEPNYFFVPKDNSVEDSYGEGISVESLFRVSTSGVTTSNDTELVNTQPFSTPNNQPYAYKPFDNQWIDYDLKRVNRPRFKVMSSMLKDNIGLILRRTAENTNEWTQIFISRYMCDGNFLSARTYQFPLYIYVTAIDGQEERVPNLNREEWTKFSSAAGRKVSPEELLAYTYGILHSPTYRERYRELLKIDFPRIPLPEDGEQFDALAAAGQQLIDLHLMRHAERWQPEAQFPDAGPMNVDSPTMEPSEDGYCSVRINPCQRFTHVPLAAWQCHIGGYQPAQKWLKDRRGHQLTFDDVLHYLRLLHALAETVRLMKEIKT